MAIKDFASIIDAETSEIVVIGSSLKGLLQVDRYNEIRDKLRFKIAQGGVRVKFLSTHPVVADLRAKQEAQEAGFNWQDFSSATVGKETISANDVPSTIDEVSDEIVKEVLVCEGCDRNFRITPSELAFYRRMHLPLPRKDFECRHKARMNSRNPRKLWHRKCECAGQTSHKPSAVSHKEDTAVYNNTSRHFHGDEPCPNEFKTSYNPKRKEIVYCEACYQAEVV